MPEDNRLDGPAATSRSLAGLEAAPDAVAARLAVRPLVSFSSRLFQDPHWGHCPCHMGKRPEHWEQTYVRLIFMQA